MQFHKRRENLSHYSLIDKKRGTDMGWHNASINRTWRTKSDGKNSEKSGNARSLWKNLADDYFRDNPTRKNRHLIS